MAFKLTQILVLLAVVTTTLQSHRKLVSDDDANSLLDDGLLNLVKHLKTHAYPNRDSKLHSDMHRSDPSSLLNIHTVNLYVKNDNKKPSVRSGDRNEQDRSCKYGRCGCKGDRCDVRQEDRDEDREEPNEVQQILDELEKELDKDPLRCAERCGGKNRCGCKTRNVGEDDEEQIPSCRSGNCGVQRNENLKSKIEQFGKKYKISDDLDAIVVDISDFKGLIRKLNSNVKNDDSANKGVDLDYLFGEPRSVNNKEDSGDLDAVVLNLGQDKGDNDVVNKVVNDLLYKTKQQLQKDDDDDPVRPNELANFYELKKQEIVGNALNFVRNSRGSKDLSNLSKGQQYQLQKVRSEVQRLGARANLKDVEDHVLDIVLGEGIKSEVLPHNKQNNNVYVPGWVYRVLKASREDLRSKQLFPLTSQQKLKMKLSSKNSRYGRRNNKKNEYGVPFKLQVQGLGQID